MSNNSNTVRIEQKLEVPGRLFFFTTDDAAMFLGPCLVGFLGRSLIPGIVIGLILFSLWRRLKGEGGVERLKAAAYWFLPVELSPYRSFPRSDVVHWRG
ncbi:type IV conjugative transfer system protein TraL [Roseobacter sp. HKCCD9010]|uniref:type IV conjugative transfer system protein TraL n=1 Tax=unclassified Roseobacter TaxID=196798 RepID=UPI001492A7CC|nr:MULTISPECIES: type IV conjugative transfer system protein TraL [unclassified Roseobacter]MBF9052275.1 type IV conjugative transfer system protein TraL [Rhodobacterales bacterium HKCCD4356]NNV14205.1 type IV conjugative transfer system protein TraL [Roseobacter sp. HKCCD7357]NNV18435.1 type IV conjugative transfer system protein TraL [Roseobacter sp. HKCCD8768]NNV27868.1 type IV conjugative transfer system protein TraL [Roseobacter sp. HKCCD8192]NNV32134.1 type IV conjugative transfer system